MWSRTMLRVTQKAAARRRKGQERGTGATGQGTGCRPSEQGAERRGPKGGSPRGKQRRSGAEERACLLQEPRRPLQRAKPVFGVTPPDSAGRRVPRHQDDPCPQQCTAPSGPLQVPHTAGVTAGAGFALRCGAHSRRAVSQDKRGKKGGGRRKPKKSRVTSAAPRQALPAP